MEMHYPIHRRLRRGFHTPGGAALLLLLLMAAPAQARKSARPAPPGLGAGGASLGDAFAAPPAKAVSAGTFHDAAGQAHPWRITPTHALEWDGAPYLPAGGSFTPHTWAEDQSDADWDADTQALQTLKQHNVTDLCLYAGAGGLTRVPPAAVQRLLDYLDANGFRYGLEIADFPKDPLVGYTVEPAVFRDPAPPVQGPVNFSHIAGLQDALYVLVSAKDREVQETGAADVTAPDTATVQVKNGTDDVLILYPRRRFGPQTPEGHLPDLWQGYDEYRDRLLSFFSRVRLGKGFRFFLDPLTEGIGLNGEVENLVPTTDGFRRDFEAWLDQRYRHNLDALNRKWGIDNRDVPDFAAASRCVPLFYQRRGVPALYDPVTKATFAVTNKLNAQNSLFWDDLQTFKIESTRGYMNAVADALKKGVADVPVVYQWTQHSPLFTNGAQAGGYDGLGMEAYGHGLDLSRSVGAYVYAQAEEAPRTTWLIASGTADAPPDQKAAPGLVSQAVLFDDWDDLKAIGARGFFAQSLQRLPAADNANVNLAALPNQLGWIGSYEATLQASAAGLAAERPLVLWYPQGVAGLGVGVRLLPGGVWWLPTFRPGQGLPLGPDLLGYTLPDPADGQPLDVVWSPHGAAAAAHFDLGKKAAPVFLSAAGAPLPVPHKGTVWTVPVGAVPVVVRGVPSLPLSEGAPDAADKLAHRLLDLALKDNVNDSLIEEADSALFRDETTYHDTPENDGIRYAAFTQVVDALTLSLRPYTWVEAEGASEYTFDSIAPDTDASGGAYLSLNTDRDPVGDDYHVTCEFSVTAPGRYALWAAGTPPDTPSASPYTWQVDDGPASDVRDVTTEGGAYAGKFVWADLGDLPLARGKHTLTIRVTGRRALDRRYALALDAFCVAREAFHPDGPRQPPLVIPPDVTGDKSKQRPKAKKK